MIGRKSGLNGPVRPNDILLKSVELCVVHSVIRFEGASKLYFKVCCLAGKDEILLQRGDVPDVLLVIP